MMEVWLLVAYLQSREFADDEQIQNGIKVAFHRMIVQFEYAIENKIYPAIPKGNEEFVFLAFEHPELKVAPEYYFDNFRNIEERYFAASSYAVIYSKGTVLKRNKKKMSVDFGNKASMN